MPRLHSATRTLLARFLPGLALLPVLGSLALAAEPTRGEGRRIAPPPVAADSVPRAILVSLDGLNEAIFRRTLTPEDAPTLWALFGEGSCADHALSHFPSLTAPSHAALWTGAFGDVTGVTANTMPRLPRDAHTILETTNGFHYSTLSAEPLWVTAGKVGIPVAGHHVTQAPGVPGYAPELGARTPAQEARRRESETVLARPDVNVLNGYNVLLAGQRVVRGRDVRWEETLGWEGAESLESARPPRAFRWTPAEGVELHGLVVARREGGEASGAAPYNGLYLSRTPSLQGAVWVSAAPVESEPLQGGRGLARHFAEALEVEVPAGRVYVPLRLFEVSPEGNDFLFYQPPLHVVEGNRADLTEAYDRALGGWPGNSGYLTYRLGGFGPRIMEGGDGTAEARYLETAEHLLRQFNEGSTWLWEGFAPRLLMDYFPLSDAIDHELLGFLDPANPGHDPEVAAKVLEFRARVWGLVDRRLAHLRGLALASGATVFVTGDHGMRASWQSFHPNLALQEAGLLTLDEAGNIDLSRTKAASANGYWITINRTAQKEGIVPPEEEAQVLEAVIRALEGVVGPDGTRVVTRIFTPATHPELGIGGAAGGDVYWGTAPGIRSVGSVRGEGALQSSFLTAGHGFPPDEPDMFTVFCAWGPDFPAGRIPAVRTTVVAPTVAEYTGIPRPADAVGRSVLAALKAPGDPLREALEARIREEGDSIVVAVALHDLATGRRMEIGADRSFHAASTMKVPVLLELYRAIDAGILAEETPIPVVNTFRSVYDGSPFTLEEDTDEGLLEVLGGTLPARRIAHGMITVSSNLGTNILLGILTPQAVQAQLDLRGAGEMRVRRGVSDIPAFEAGYSNETTARGYLRTLELVARCEGVSRASCAAMHEILEAQEYRSEIPAGLPEGVRVGNKTGSITRILHDGAMVWPGEGPPYLLVILTEGYLDKDRGSALMAELSQMVWASLSASENRLGVPIPTTP